MTTNGQSAAAFFANTDFGWFSHILHYADPPDEVDFWQPSRHGFKAMPPGAPFFFRLGAPHKAPHKAITGFGFFARYERAPMWLADHPEWHPHIRGGKTSEGARAVQRAASRALLLRADIRRLYDAGRVTVTPDYRFRVRHDLFDDFHNGRACNRIAGRAITVPRAPGDQPDPQLLDWYAQAVFRG